MIIIHLLDSFLSELPLQDEWLERTHAFPWHLTSPHSVYLVNQMNEVFTDKTKEFFKVLS